jgi:Arc/MetJ-type ribon-helix-helix transcriptional regulator
MWRRSWWRSCEANRCLRYDNQYDLWYDKNMKKVTVSLPDDLLRFADERADRVGESRSQVVAKALEILKRIERDRLMAEGYRFYSDADVEIAESGLGAMREVLPSE